MQCFFSVVMFNLSLFLNKLPISIASSCCQLNSIFFKCMCFKLCINIILWTVYKRALLIEFVLKLWNLSRIRSCSIQFQEMVWRTEKYFENEYVVLLYLVQPRMYHICRTELPCVFYTTAFEDHNVQMHVFLCCYNRAAYIKARSLLQVGKTK